MSYLLVFCTVSLGLISLYKDWHNYKHPRIRQVVALLIIVAGTFSIIKQAGDASRLRKN